MGRQAKPHMNDSNPGGVCGSKPSFLLERRHLLRQLGDTPKWRIAAVCAEAGYGKTSLLVEYARSWPYLLVWHRLSRGDRAVDRFLLRLAETIDRSLQRPGTRLRRQAVGKADLGSALPDLLVDRLERLGQGPLLLILDGYEAVETCEQVDSVVADLVEVAGSALHVVVASRMALPLPVARWETYGEAVTLGSADLALTVDESRELLLAFGRAGLSSAQVESLWQRSEGWPVGLLLLAGALESCSSPDKPSYVDNPTALPDLLYRYLDDELFQPQPVALQRFMVQTSILERLSHDVVNELLGIGNAGELLVTARARGTFLRTVDASAELFRFPDLIRKFFQQKLHAHHGDEYIRSLYVQAGDATWRHRAWDDATRLYSAAANWERVAEVVEQSEDEFVLPELPESLQRCIQSIPDEVVARHPLLMLLRGRILRMGGHPENALRWLKDARSATRCGISPALVGEMGLEMGLALDALGKLQRAETEFRNALQHVESNTALRCRILAALALNRTNSDQLEEGVRLGEMALSEASSVRTGRIPPLVQALRYYGRALMLQGELQLGLQYLSQSVELCYRERVERVDVARSLQTLGLGLVLIGKFDEAHTLFDEAEPLARDSYPWLYWIRVWRGIAHRDQGLLDDAERDFLQVLEAPPRAGVVAKREMAVLRLRQDRVADALGLAETSLRSCDSPESTAEKPQSEAVCAIMLAQIGDCTTAVQRLLDVAALLRRAGRRHQLASLQWHLAWLLKSQGRHGEAMEHLGETVQWGAAGGAFNLWWWDPRTVARLWPTAIEAGWAPSYLIEIARQRLGPAECRFLYPSLEVADPVLRVQVMNTLRAVSGDSLIHVSAAELLQGCRDPIVHRRIGQALSSGSLTPGELSRLREVVGLTWREIEVLVTYYLHSSDKSDIGRSRRAIAQSLGISEHTLKIHVHSLRQKLSLNQRRKGSETFTLPLPRLSTPGSGV